MTYTASIYLLLFLPVSMIFYNLMPQKHRWKVLLVASYLFFAIISRKLIFYLIASTFSIHHFGLWLGTIQNECNVFCNTLEKDQRKVIKLKYLQKKRNVLILAVALHIGLLVYLKYMPFMGMNLNLLLVHLPISFSMPIFKFALPIGISFYTLQAVSYITDVYRGTIKPDKKLGRLALFMSFFPQIMEGPICRYSQTATKLFEGNSITHKNATFGYQRIFWGLFKKMVVADRLNLLIKTVFNDYPKYSGAVVFVGMIFYTCQLYMEFSGTMDIVIGSGQVFGVTLPENFRQPFFSKNVSEFWTRWHITLGSFFKDYIFYPLSLSKHFKKITSKSRITLGNYFGPLIAGTCALFVVWICNGLWHGSAWNYIFFGLYYFVLIVLANFTAPISKKILAFLHVNKQSKIYTAWQIFRTLCLVCIGELFFRANGLRAGLAMFKKMITDFNFSTFSDGVLLKLGMDKHDYAIVLIAVLIVLTMSIFKERGVHIRERISKMHIFFRYLIIYLLILAIVIFGAYGVGYEPVPMIYAAF